VRQFSSLKKESSMAHPLSHGHYGIYFYHNEAKAFFEIEIEFFFSLQ